MQEIIISKREIGVGPLINKIQIFDNKSTQVTFMSFGDIPKCHNSSQTIRNLKYLPRTVQ
jgi:hypothetical protein